MTASPSLADETVARASQALGGAWGRHAAGGRWWTPLRVMLALVGLTLLLGYAEKAPCASGDWGSANKQYTHVCYSDVIPLWGAEGLDRNQVPYRDHAVEYPVLTGGFMWLTSAITHAVVDDHPSFSGVVVFGAVTCALLALCGLLTLAGTVGAAGRRPWDAALFALSPLLIFHAFSNWDLLAMAFTSAALWAWARSRPVLSGTMIGLGTAAKLYPALLLVPILLLAIRTRRWREAIWCTIAALVAWSVVNLPIAFAYRTGWWEFYRLSITRPAEASTAWFMANYESTVGPGGGYPPAWTPPGLAVTAALVVGLSVVAVLALLAPQRPRLAQLVFLTVLVFLLTTKVWSPQYSLWLVPLLALARPRWRIALIWQGAEILVWVLTLLWLAGFSTADRGIEYQWLMFALLIRDALLLVIAGLIVQEIWRPDLDVVRSGGLDDPGGGPFDGAVLETWVLPSPPVLLDDWPDVVPGVVAYEPSTQPHEVQRPESDLDERLT